MQIQEYEVLFFRNGRCEKQFKFQIKLKSDDGLSLPNI